MSCGSPLSGRVSPCTAKSPKVNTTLASAVFSSRAIRLVSARMLRESTPMIDSARRMGERMKRLMPVGMRERNSRLSPLNDLASSSRGSSSAEIGRVDAKAYPGSVKMARESMPRDSRKSASSRAMSVFRPKSVYSMVFFWPAIRSPFTRRSRKVSPRYPSTPWSVKAMRAFNESALVREMIVVSTARDTKHWPRTSAEKNRIILPDSLRLRNGRGIFTGSRPPSPRGSAPGQPGAPHGGSPAGAAPA